MPGGTVSNSNYHRTAVNTQTKVLDTVQGRILCIADIRGNISHLNTLAQEANAKAIIHTGDFGFIGESRPSITTPCSFSISLLDSHRQR
jgi:hypothetical protein